MNILVCTLGSSWAVVPEVFGLIAPGRLDLFANHPDRAALEVLRETHSLAEPDELWIVTTEGTQAARSLGALREWWRLIGAPIPLRVWTARGTDQLATQAECDHIRELIYRVVMLAAEHAGAAGQLVLSLAGGRKTMSADLQSAGSTFGAHAWVHVVGPDPLPEEMKAATPERFISALPGRLAGSVRPVVVGSGSRNEVLDVEVDGVRVDAAHFPLPLATLDCGWPMPSNGTKLMQEIARRQREGSRLFGNFLAAVASAEHHENWRSLYRLPPSRIEALRQSPIDASARGWLALLPKADLHRHLGGCLDLPAQRRVGRAIWSALTRAERAQALDVVASLIGSRSDWPWDWPGRLVGAQRAANCAALLVEADDAQLVRNLYDVTEPRFELRDSTRGFGAYERPGELSGSAVLTHPAALEPYAAALVEQARAEGLAYVELRGSPHKYRRADPGGFVQELDAALRRATGTKGPRFGFIWILDRRQRDRIASTIVQAVAARERHDDFLFGLDVAGDETAERPEQLASSFIAAFRACLKITIHAGEGESAQNVWEAAYHLHADRIGHGLTLLDNPRLAARFRDRGICVELCPTSNREVVGFRDPLVPESIDREPYPLRGMLDAGLPLTIATDNPGISRTTLGDEIVAAARMTERSLTQWEALALLRQGFVHAFLPAAERDAVLKRAEKRVHELVASANEGSQLGIPMINANVLRQGSDR